MSAKRLTLNVKVPARLADDWVAQGSAAPLADGPRKSEVYTARLTIDITSNLRQRIKLAALSGGTTVAKLLRELLEREYAGPPEGRS